MDQNQAAQADSSAPATLEEALALLAKVGEENRKLRLAFVDKLMAETMLAEMTMNKRGTEIAMEGGACRILAQSFADQFRGAGAINYLETSFHMRDGLDLFVTIQKKSGKTPGQLRREADERTQVVEGLARSALNAWSTSSGNVPGAMQAISAYFKDKDGPYA